MRILIVGAGIGGLAVASQVGGEGHAPTIIERAAEWTQPPQVIGLWSNTLDTLVPFGFNERIAGLGRGLPAR